MKPHSCPSNFYMIDLSRSDSKDDFTLCLVPLSGALGSNDAARLATWSLWNLVLVVRSKASTKMIKMDRAFLSLQHHASVK